MDITILKKITSNFVRELQDAQKRKKTSLPFIIHRLPEAPLVGDDEIFQVIKIGGTILQKSDVYSRNGNIIIKTLEEKHLPQMANKDVFLALIDSNLNPKTTVLALNFAYQLKPVFRGGKLEGILTTSDKEHAFLGLVGQNICEAIEHYIKTTYNRHIRVSVANDTICIVMAGRITYPAHILAGGVVGTGMNFAFYLDESHLVNLEAAFFNKFPQSAEGRIIDSQSLNTGASVFEKEVSGEYLYRHLNILLAKHYIHHPAIKTTEQLNRLAEGNIEKVSVLAQELFEYSARLIACQIAGIAEFKKRDMVFVMEGSLFWDGWHYKQMVETFVSRLTKYKVTFEEINNCGIIGAAKLVT